MDISPNPTTPADGARELEVQKRRLRENCREFESMMTSYLMKSMRETVLRAEEPDSAREMYEDMLTAQMSKEIGKSSAMGLGDILYKNLEPLVKSQYAAAHKTTKPEGPEAGPKDSAAPAAIEAPGVESESAESISFKK